MGCFIFNSGILDSGWGILNQSRPGKKAGIRPIPNPESPIPAGRQASSAKNSWIRCSPGASRSEEHTSELQSLMRISYADFCLKKKNIDSNNIYNISNHKQQNLKPK